MTNEQQALKDLLESGNVKRAIYIDDSFAFNGKADVERVIGLLNRAFVESPERTLEIVQVPYPEDIWKIAFRDIWDELGLDDKDKVVDAILEIINEQINKDRKVASGIKDLFPEDFEYYEISPSSWEDDMDKYLANIDDSWVICLFDQDLSSEPPFTREGSRSGGGLLKKLIDSGNANNMLFGILSHTIIKIEDEHAYHESFSANFQIDDLNPEKYLPLAKSRLDDPMKFVDGLKKLLIHNSSAAMKKSALHILNTAHEKAIKEFQALDVYAFDHIILQAAYAENEWEIDTLLRLFQIHHRNSVKEILNQPGRMDSITDLVNKVRPTSQIVTISDEHIYPKIRELRRNELYENQSLLVHRPIETGDIFEGMCLNGEKKSYILLSQPCDLAVRRNGMRAQEYVSLIPISQERKQSRKTKDRLECQGFWSTRALIDIFFTDPTLLAILEFKKAVTIRTSVLDLAVLNQDGLCIFDINNVLIPEYLTDGWKLLLEKRIEFYTQQSQYFERISSELTSPGQDKNKEEFLNSFLSSFLLPLDMIKANYATGVFDFNLRRVERYRQPGADQLLKTYAHFLSREAKDFDFAN